MKLTWIFGLIFVAVVGGNLVPYPFPMNLTGTQRYKAAQAECAVKPAEVCSLILRAAEGTRVDYYALELAIVGEDDFAKRGATHGAQNSTRHLINRKWHLAHASAMRERERRLRGFSSGFTLPDEVIKGDITEHRYRRDGNLPAVLTFHVVEALVSKAAERGEYGLAKDFANRAAMHWIDDAPNKRHQSGFMGRIARIQLSHDALDDALDTLRAANVPSKNCRMFIDLAQEFDAAGNKFAAAEILNFVRNYHHVNDGVGSASLGWDDCDVWIAATSIDLGLFEIAGLATRSAQERIARRTREFSLLDTSQERQQLQMIDDRLALMRLRKSTSPE